MDTSTFTSLSRALDLGSARLQAASDNLANVNTPGFKRRDATFAALLQDAQSDGGPLPQRTTDARHLTLADDPGSEAQGPALTTQTSGSMRADGNNVDIDAETSRLAAAEVYYQGAAQLMSGQFSAMKYAISGGR